MKVLIVIELEEQRQYNAFHEFVHANKIVIDSRYSKEKWEWMRKMSLLAAEGIKTCEKLDHLSKELNDLLTVPSQPDLPQPLNQGKI